MYDPDITFWFELMPCIGLIPGSIPTKPGFMFWI